MNASPSPSHPDPKLEQVRTLLRSLLQEGRSDEAIDLALTLLQQLQTNNTELSLELSKLRRERMGKRSERIDPAQLSLLLQLAPFTDREDAEDRVATAEEDESLRLDQEAAEAEAPEAERRRPRRRRPSRRLPREIIRHELSEEERRGAACGEVMRSIGEDVSELVELVPAQFVVQEHHRAKYACGRCRDGVQTAPGPDKLIDKGLPGPGLVAHTAMSKFRIMPRSHAWSRSIAGAGSRLRAQPSAAGSKRWPGKFGRWWRGSRRRRWPPTW
jgi:transposase